MKYKFKVTLVLDEASNGSLSDPEISLAVVGALDATLIVDANTELPDELIEALRVRVSTFLSDKLGVPVDASFVNSEH